MKALLAAIVALAACSSAPASRTQALTEATYYVECGYDDHGLPAETAGDDSHECNSAAAPCRTIAGVDAKVCGGSPCDAPAGKRVVIQLCGHGGAAPCVSPESARYCWQESVRIGGTDAFQNTWVLRGPRDMLQVQALTVTSISLASGSTTGRRVRVNVSSPSSFTSGDYGCVHRGQFLRTVRADGRESWFPLPIAECGAGFVEIRSSMTVADIASELGQGETWTIVQPAVWLRHPDAQDMGVLVRGQGADHLGDVADPVWDATLERIGVRRLWVGADGVSLENVQVHDGYQQRGDGTKYRNTSMRNGFILGDSISQGRGSTYNIYTEPMGRCVSAGGCLGAPVATRNPRAAFDGANIVSFGPFFVGDYSQGNDAGQLRIDRALSTQAHWTVDGGVNVIGAGSVLWMTDNAYLFTEQQSAASGPLLETVEGSGAWVKDGGLLRLRACQAIGTVGTNHVDFVHPAQYGSRFARVGWGPSISMADFCGTYAAEGWEGNFSRVLEQVTTPMGQPRPVFDWSTVRDKVHEVQYGAPGETPFYSTNGSGGQG